MHTILKSHLVISMNEEICQNGSIPQTLALLQFRLRDLNLYMF